jgi:hypothetical protein
MNTALEWGKRERKNQYYPFKDYMLLYVLAGFCIIILYFIVLYYIILFLTAISWHAVAVLQYTFTQKQYTEYREWNIRNNQTKIWEVRAVPRLRELYPGICLKLRKKHGKTSVRVVEKFPDIPVAVVQYTFTLKQHKYDHNETENNTIKHSVWWLHCIYVLCGSQGKQ